MFIEACPVGGAIEWRVVVTVRGESRGGPWRRIEDGMPASMRFAPEQDLGEEVSQSIEVRRVSHE